MRTGHGGAGSAEECGGKCQTDAKKEGCGGEDEDRRRPISGAGGVLVVVINETTYPHSPSREKKNGVLL